MDYKNLVGKSLNEIEDDLDVDDEPKFERFNDSKSNKDVIRKKQFKSIFED